MILSELILYRLSDTLKNQAFVVNLHNSAGFGRCHAYHVTLAGYESRQP